MTYEVCQVGVTIRKTGDRRKNNYKKQNPGPIYSSFPKQNKDPSVLHCQHEISSDTEVHGLSLFAHRLRFRGRWEIGFLGHLEMGNNIIVAA